MGEGQATASRPVELRGTDGLLLAVEGVSKDSEIVDRIIKKAEYAKAGVPRYWVVERGSITTVLRHTLDRATSEYEPDPAGRPPVDRLAAHHHSGYRLSADHDVSIVGDVAHAVASRSRRRLLA